MYVVGSDQIAVRDQRVVPAGPQHAVDQQGRALCRANRPRFTWPALDWPHPEAAKDADPGACPLCAQVRRSQDTFATAPAYPADPIPSQPLAEAAREEPIWW
jgi:hypothetical protein